MCLSIAPWAGLVLRSASPSSSSDAAFARFPVLPLAFFPSGVDALILLGILRDLIVDRLVHKVYLYAFPSFILFQIFCMQTYLHASPWWVRIANALLH